MSETMMKVGARIRERRKRREIITSHLKSQMENDKYMAMLFDDMMQKKYSGRVK